MISRDPDKSLVEDLSYNNIFAKLDFSTLIRVIPFVSKATKKRLKEIIPIKYDVNLETLKEIFLRLTPVYQNAVLRGDIELLDAEWMRFPPYLRSCVEDNTLTRAQARTMHKKLFNNAHFIDRLTVGENFDLAVFGNYFHTPLIFLLTSELVRLVDDDRFNKFCFESFHAHDRDTARKIRFEFLNEVINKDLPNEAHVTMEEIVEKFPDSVKELKRWMVLLNLSAHHARRMQLITRKDILTLPISELMMKILNSNLSLDRQLSNKTGRDLSLHNFLLAANMIYVIEQGILTFFEYKLNSQFFPLTLIASCNEGLNTIGHTLFTENAKIPAYNGRRQQRMIVSCYPQVLSLVLERANVCPQYHHDRFLWANGDEYYFYNYSVAKHLVESGHSTMQDVLDATLTYRHGREHFQDRKYYYTYNNSDEYEDESDLYWGDHPIDFDVWADNITKVSPLLLFSERALRCFKAGMLRFPQALNMSGPELAKIIFQDRVELKAESVEVLKPFTNNKEKFDALVNEFKQTHPTQIIPEIYMSDSRYAFFNLSAVPFLKNGFPEDAPLPLQNVFLRAIKNLIKLNKLRESYIQNWIKISNSELQSDKDDKLIIKLMVLLFSETDLQEVLLRSDSFAVLSNHKKAGAICKHLGNEKDRILNRLKYLYNEFLTNVDPYSYNEAITEISSFVEAELKAYVSTDDYRKKSILKVDQSIVISVHQQLLDLTNHCLSSYKEKSNRISAAQHRIMTELQKLLQQNNNSKDKQLVNFANKLRLAQADPNFYQHTDSNWKRYIKNVLAILLVIPALWLMLNSYQNYNTCRFWLPKAQMYANHAEKILENLPGTMVA